MIGPANIRSSQGSAAGGLQNRWVSRAALVAAVLVIFSLQFPHAAHALLAPGKVAAFNGNAATKDPGALDQDEALATDGNGNWVAVWRSDDSLGGTIGNDDDVLVARSSDGGRSWSLPIALNTDAATDTSSEGDVLAQVATDGAGVWLVTWRKGLGVGVGLSATSLDNGASWSSPVSVGFPWFPFAISSLGGSQWVTFALTVDDLGGTIGTDTDLVALRSSDDGATWSAPVLVNTDATTDSGVDGLASVATDGAGTFVVVWSRDSAVVLAATSLDSGLSWSAPVMVTTFNNLPNALRPRIASDGVGKWIVAWSSDDDLGGTIGSDDDILYSVSTDAGSTWSAEAAVDPNAGTDTDSDSAPEVDTDGSGTWYIAWTIGNADIGFGDKDIDLAVSRSTDDAQTWTAPVALNTNASRDKESDSGVQLYYDGNGEWVSVWGISDPFTSDILFAHSRDDCTTVPQAGCLTSSRALLDLKDKTGAKKDRLMWKWSKGAETTLADFGDPLTSSSYAFCLYDGISGVDRVELEKDAAVATTCKDKPCWGGTTKGFKYKDGRRENGAIKAVKLNAGVAGKASVKLTAKGVTLGPPNLPFMQSPEVTVQMINLETGVCWESVFDSAAVIENSPGRFKAKF